MRPKYITFVIAPTAILLGVLREVLNNSVDRRIGVTGYGPLVSPKHILAFSRILSVALLMFGFGYLLWTGDRLGSAVGVGGIALGGAYRALDRINQRLDEWIPQVNASTFNKAFHWTREDSPG